MQYSLEIAIDDSGLKSIYAAGQSVTLVKSVVSDPLSSGNLPIAWITFQPLENNTVTWIENYNLYASTTVLQSGAQISMTSQTEGPVQVGWVYSFAQGQFAGVSGTGSTFNLNNQMQGTFNFGLAQAATVNNVSTVAPLNAVPVLFNESATFTPEEVISVFLSSYSNNGTVIAQVASNALSVTLTSQNPTASIGFNDATNTFYSISPAEKLARRLRRIA